MSQSIYKNTSENVLASGLHQMTKACETITKQNEILNQDIKKLKSKLTQAKEKLLLNNIEV
jgi:hypothetical protein